MARRITYFLLLFVMLGCSSHKPQGPASETKGPRLILEASPRQGFTPLHVTFHAVLEGVKENDPDYYCLKEEWNFGDGAISAEEVNCDPYTENYKITAEFFAEHPYNNKGEYTVFLKLGDRKIRSNSVVIYIIENRPTS